MQQRIHCDLVAMNQIENSFRKARLMQQGSGHGGRHRNFFGRLQHERVAACDGERPHPHRHHRREIERRDANAHTNRLSNSMAVDSARYVVQRIAHHQTGHAAGHFHHLDGPAHFHAGIVNRLAVFGGQRGGQIVRVFFEQRLIPEERLHALHNRNFAPLQIGSVGGLDGAIHIGGRCVCYLRDGCAGGWICHRQNRAASSCFPFTVYVKRYGFESCFSTNHVSSPIQSRAAEGARCIRMM